MIQVPTRSGRGRPAASPRSPRPPDPLMRIRPNRWPTRRPERGQPTCCTMLVAQQRYPRRPLRPAATSTSGPSITVTPVPGPRAADGSPALPTLQGECTRPTTQPPAGTPDAAMEATSLPGHGQSCRRPDATAPVRRRQPQRPEAGVVREAKARAHRQSRARPPVAAAPGHQPRKAPADTGQTRSPQP